MVASAPIVQFSAVAKRFGDGPPVLADIDLTARDRDFIAIIGPSGCGKSTLLRLIAGLSPISGGQLTILGKSPDRAAAELAHVFQEPTLLPWRRVADNVALPLQLRGVPAAERNAIVERCLQQVRLSERARAFPRQLSGGQQMRVSIARALSLAPRLMLLDEPFGALDAMTRNRLNEELLTLREQAAWTAFFVTHSVSEAVFLANRIVVLSANPGRIAHEIAVDLPYPRTPDTRDDPHYLQLVGEVGRRLRSVEAKGDRP